MAQALPSKDDAGRKVHRDKGNIQESDSNQGAQARKVGGCSVERLKNEKAVGINGLWIEVASY